MAILSGVRFKLAIVSDSYLSFTVLQLSLHYSFLNLINL
jgi:hypothetical protein